MREKETERISDRNIERERWQERETEIEERESKKRQNEKDSKMEI